MKKITFSLLAMLLVVTSAMAQISTGEPNASVLPRTGNRPQAGDYGLYLGASVTQIMDLVKLNDNIKAGDDRAFYWALPAFNIKYYATDNFEIRCGFEFAAQSKTDKTAYVKAEAGQNTNSTNRNFTRFFPGFAYHFNTKNILDVYLGAQVPIGFNTTDINTIQIRDGKKQQNKFHQGDFVIGGGLFFGLQVFVADLPFAIGIETGYSGQALLGNGNGKTTIVDDGKKYVYNGRVEGMSEQKYLPELKSSSHMEGTWHADAAITFTYFFHN